MKLFTLLLFALFGFSTSPNQPTETKQQAPEISLQNPEGQQIKLSELRGNIVLIDFWASWCGPCRRKHPELTGIYNKFKSKKFKNGAHFEIFSVSLDRNKRAWKAAIAKDHLTWSSHVSDLKGWNSSAAKAYGVQSIPSNVLINAKGEIIAKNVFGEDLAKILSNL